MTENIYIVHEAEIKQMAQLQQVDWLTALLMWQSVHPELLKDIPADEKEEMRRAFLKEVDGA
jgi:hypothetical protein